jgi:hypothetical protein
VLTAPKNTSNKRRVCKNKDNFGQYYVQISHLLHVFYIVCHVHLHFSTSLLMQSTQLETARIPFSSNHRMIVNIIKIIIVIINIVTYIYNNTISILIIKRIIDSIKYDSQKNQVFIIIIKCKYLFSCLHNSQEASYKISSNKDAIKHILTKINQGSLYKVQRR